MTESSSSHIPRPKRSLPGRRRWPRWVDSVEIEKDFRDSSATPPSMLLLVLVSSFIPLYMNNWTDIPRQWSNLPQYTRRHQLRGRSHVPLPMSRKSCNTRCRSCMSVTCINISLWSESCNKRHEAHTARSQSARWVLVNASRGLILRQREHSISVGAAPPVQYKQRAALRAKAKCPWVTNFFRRRAIWDAEKPVIERSSRQPAHLILGRVSHLLFCDDC